MSAQHLSQSVNNVAFLLLRPLFFEKFLFSNSFVFIKSFSISSKVQSGPKYLIPSSHVYKHDKSDIVLRIMNQYMTHD